MKLQKLGKAYEELAAKRRPIECVWQVVKRDSDFIRDLKEFSPVNRLRKPVTLPEDPEETNQAHQQRCNTPTGWGTAPLYCPRQLRPETRRKTLRQNYPADTAAAAPPCIRRRLKYFLRNKKMEKAISELKAMITNLAAEMSKMKLEHVEDRVFLKALNGTVDNLSGQVQKHRPAA